MTITALIVFILFVVAILAPLLLPTEWISSLPIPIRVLGGLGTLAVAAFCGFGFLATFEPLDPATQWTFRVVYILAGTAATGGAIRLFRTRSTPASL